MKSKIWRVVHLLGLAGAFFKILFIDKLSGPAYFTVPACKPEVRGIALKEQSSLLAF